MITGSGVWRDVDEKRTADILLTDRLQEARTRLKIYGHLEAGGVYVSGSLGERSRSILTIAYSLRMYCRALCILKYWLCWEE
jgi:hypothetical protein